MVWESYLSWVLDFRFESPCIGFHRLLVADEASLPHSDRNKPSWVPVESWNYALSNGISKSMVRLNLDHRPPIRRWPVLINKMFPTVKLDYADSFKM